MSTAQNCSYCCRPPFTNTCMTRESHCNLVMTLLCWFLLRLWVRFVLPITNVASAPMGPYYIPLLLFLALIFLNEYIYIFLEIYVMTKFQFCFYFPMLLELSKFI